MMDELSEGVLNDLWYDERLNVKQQEALLKLIEGKDVIAFLPTGFGKSLIYTLFPIINRTLTGKSQMLLVITPLRASMLDQQTIMKTYSIKAQFIIKYMPKESVQDYITMVSAVQKFIAMSSTGAS